MVTRLSGVNYIPASQLPKVGITVHSEQGKWFRNADTILTAHIDVTVIAQNIKKSNAVTTITRVFSQVNKMANGNLAELPPIDAAILTGEASPFSTTQLYFAVDESEEVPVANLNLEIKKMRYDLLELKLAEILQYITEVVNVDM